VQLLAGLAGGELPEGGGLAARIVLTARNAEMIKSYVRQGLGIGVIADMAFDADKDSDLAMFPLERWMPIFNTYLVWHNEMRLRAFHYDLIDRIVPNPHETLDPHDPAFQENKRRHIARVGMMAAFAITAHNFPEGLATFFATLENPAVGMPLALAIAIHNIPEGISIAAPVYFATRNRKKTVLACLASGLAEPLGAVLGYTMLKPFLSPFVFGAVFGVIAGVMVFLALDELLPSAKRYSDGHETVYGLTSGMAVIALSLVLFHF